ncbi:MAG: hypothetical protein H6739_28625 [Alphaproteobacteria bacterium]|nr:hypothetical protein [Alphaproteobacteria bacterium]
MLFVHASLLALHPGPDADAVSAWIRINTPVEVLEEDGERVRVRLLDRPPEHPVEGWVAGAFLDTEALTAADARLAREKSGDPDERQAWLERALAIDPTDPWHERLLKREIEQNGGTWVEPAGTELAMCAGGRVEYLGLLTEDRFEDRHVWDGTRRQLLDLSARTWLRVEGDHLVPIQGSPFVTPFATETWNEEGANAYTPGTCDAICEVEKKVILGPCETEGTLYVSRPVEPMPATPVGDDVVVAPVMAAPVGAQSRQLGHFVETMAWDRVRIVWGVEGTFGLNLTVGGVHYADSLQAPQHEAVWFERPGGDRYVAVVPQYFEDRLTGWVVVELGRATMRSTPVTLAGWGC